MIELSEIIEYEDLISNIPPNKLKILENLIIKAKKSIIDNKERKKITLPHLINLLVRNNEYSDDHNGLLAILQKKMRDFDKKGSNLYIRFI
jgi:hypothetical protein